MKYYDLLKIARESTQEKATHTKQQFSVKFFRELGFYFVPIYRVRRYSGPSLCQKFPTD